MHRAITLTGRAYNASIALILITAGFGSDVIRSGPSSATVATPTVVSTSETPVTTETPTTAAASTVFDGEPQTLPNSGPVDAGSYALAPLEPPAVIELADGWWAGWDYGDNVAMPEGVVALEHRLSAGFVRLAFWDTTDLEIGGRQQPDVRAFVEGLPHVTGLTEQDTTIGGFDATRLDFAWTGDYRPIINIPRAGYVLASDEPQHWIVLDTADGQLLINWTVENAGHRDEEAETLISAVLASFRL